MLQVMDDSIREVPVTLTTTTSSTGYINGTSCIDYGSSWPYQTWPYQTYWLNYPVYVCHDKTKKAIEVLKALQADKLLECKSVPRFIELVEKISAIL